MKLSAEALAAASRPVKPWQDGVSYDLPGAPVSPAIKSAFDGRMATAEAERIGGEKTAKMAKWRADCARAARFGIKPIPRLADTETTGELPYHEERRLEESQLIESLTYKRESDYVEHSANTAGHILPADKYAESLQRRFVRWDQSTKLAAALIEGGARQAESRKNAPCIITLCTRKVIELPILPRVNFLPEVAAMRRSPMLAEVEAYAAAPGHEWDRMATFTEGPRCPLPELRERTQAFTRKISRLNSEKWFKPRASIPFRALEFGTPKLLPSAGYEFTLHIHAHTILHLRRFMAPKKWRKFCRKISAFMGARWDGGRPIENAREMVKYPVKPADLETMLALGGPSAICAFYTATKGLRLVETLGDLRRSRSSIKNTKRKRVKERNAQGEWLPAVRRSWNSQGRSVTKHAQRAKRASVELRAASVEAIDSARGFCNLPEVRKLAPKMLNRIVARLAPAPFASQVYEPAAFVWNFTGDLDAICGHRSVARVVEVCTPKVEESLRRLARNAGRAAPAHNSPHQSHNCPDHICEFPAPDPQKAAFRHHLEAIAT